METGKPVSDYSKKAPRRLNDSWTSLDPRIMEQTRINTFKNKEIGKISFELEECFDERVWSGNSKFENMKRLEEKYTHRNQKLQNKIEVYKLKKILNTKDITWSGEIDFGVNQIRSFSSLKSISTDLSDLTSGGKLKKQVRFA